MRELEETESVLANLPLFLRYLKSYSSLTLCLSTLMASCIGSIWLSSHCLCTLIIKVLNETKMSNLPIMIHRFSLVLHGNQ